MSADESAVANPRTSGDSPAVAGALLPIALSIEPPLPPLQLMRDTQTASRMNMRKIIGVLSMVPWLPLEGGSMTSLRHKACTWVRQSQANIIENNKSLQLVAIRDRFSVCLWIQGVVSSFTKGLGEVIFSLLSMLTCSELSAACRRTRFFSFKNSPR
jgi:hypothetical protein